MAFYYVRSTTGSDSFNGSSWNTAKQTITGALNIAVPGDTIYVSQSHNYITGSTITYPTKGSFSMPIAVVCVNDATQPPTQLANTASESMVSTSNDMWFANSSAIYWSGIVFKSARSIYFPYNSYNLPFDNCTFQLLNSTQGVWHFSSATLNSFYNLQFNNCNFISTWSGASIYAYLIRNWQYNSSNNWWTGDISWMVSLVLSFKNCSFSGVVFSNIFKADSQYQFWSVYMDSCDISSMGTGSSLISSVTNLQPGSKFYFKNCKLSSTANLFNTSIPYYQQPDVYLDNCDSGTSNMRNEVHKFQGTIRTSTNIYRTGGAYNGSTGYSYILETNSYTGFLLPLDSLPISAWCGTYGTQKTITIEFAHDSSAEIGSNDIWAEVEYQNSSGSPITAFASTKVTTYPFLISSPTEPVISSNSTWTVPGFSTPMYQKFQIPFTPQMDGLVVIKIYLARPNYTVYIDPMVTLS